MLRGSREWVSFGILLIVGAYGVIPALLLKLGYAVPPYLLAEDGFYEMTGVVACILAFAFLVSAYWKTRPRNVWLILLALGILVLALEELSWGQRLMSISLSEEVKELNFQREMNLHNSSLLQSTNGDVSLVLRIGYLAYFFGLPFCLIVFPSLQRFTRALRLPTPSHLIAMAVVVSQLAHTVNISALTNTGVPIWGSRLGEAHESNLQIILLFFALEVWWSSKGKTPGWSKGLDQS